MSEGLGRGGCASVLLIFNSLDDPPRFIPLISGISMVLIVNFSFYVFICFSSFLIFEDYTIKWELDNMKNGIRYELAY